MIGSTGLGGGSGFLTTFTAFYVLWVLGEEFDGVSPPVGLGVEEHWVLIARQWGLILGRRRVPPSPAKQKAAIIVN